MVETLSKATKKETEPGSVDMLAIGGSGFVASAVLPALEGLPT